MWPVLEYASTIWGWDPAAKTESEIDKLEAVQPRTARFALNRHHKDSKSGHRATGAQLAYTGELQTDRTPHHAVQLQDPQRLGPSQMPTPEAAATEITAHPHSPYLIFLFYKSPADRHREAVSRAAPPLWSHFLVDRASTGTRRREEEETFDRS